MRLWGLHQDVLFRFGVYTVFRRLGHSVPAGSRGYVLWLVPLDTPKKDEIVAYLEHELADLQRETQEVLGTVIPGTDVVVDVMVFSGVQPYVTRDELEVWARKAAQTLMDRIKREGLTP